jgi:hypothetical protein
MNNRVCHFERSEKSLAFDVLPNSNSKGFLASLEMTDIILILFF